jgi:Flp pilus assembly protein TadG
MGMERRVSRSPRAADEITDAGLSRRRPGLVCRESGIGKTTLLGTDSQKKDLELVSDSSLVGNRKGIQCDIGDITERQRETDAIREDKARDRAGAAAVEFALVAPFLLLLVMGTAQFGITLNNYLVLTNAVSAAARQLAISRSAATPRTSAVNRLYGAAANLTQSSLTITISVNGTACATDTTCATALLSNTGNPANVAASYPCDLKVMGIDFSPGCRLSSTTTERIE